VRTTAAGAGVRWVGAQRTVLAGDLRAHISLERLAGLRHLYALGPVAGHVDDLRLGPGMTLRLPAAS